MSIKIEHRNLEIRKTRNDFSVQVWNFLLPLSLKDFWHKEREAQSFYSGFFICTPISCDTCPRPPWASENQLSHSVSSLNSLTFFKFPKCSTCFRCMTSPALCNPVSHLGLLWHLWVICPLCVWIPVLMLHLTNPCAEPKGSQPN